MSQGGTEDVIQQASLAAMAQSESPAALAELGDNDNNHFLCLDTTTPATAVAFRGASAGSER